MIVYMLESGIYETEQIGLFSSYELAEQYAEHNKIYQPSIFAFKIDELLEGENLNE